MALSTIIVGAGEVGSYLAKYLSQEHSVVKVIDIDADKLKSLQEQLDILVVHGSGASVEVLREAECKSAGLILATTDSDEVNLVACMVAKKLGAKRAIARIRHKEHFVSHSFYRNLLGIDLVVDPDALVAVEVENLVRETGTVGVEYFADGRVELRKIVLDDSCRIAGKPLHEVGFPEDSLVVAVIRDNNLLIPTGADHLAVGDTVHVITRGDSKKELHGLFGIERGPSKSVMILGGGGIGTTIAKRLSRHRVAVKIIEASRQRGWQISQDLPRVQVIHGDGTDIELLRSEYIENVDLFISVTHNDEMNIISALMARELGARKVVAIVDRPSYLPLAQKLKVDVAVSPRLLASSKILAFARSPHIHSLSLVGVGEAEVLEYHLPHGSGASGRPLVELNLPPGVIIGAVVRENDVIIPRGHTVLLDGDTVIAFTLAEHVSTVSNLFS
jgi:trk system potassium uptake protein TrkA